MTSKLDHLWRYSRPLFLFLFLLAASDAWGQAPDSINYQAVARDDQGKVLANEDLNVRMSVFKGSSNGTLVYEEEHSNVSTNQFGLFNLYIGGGNQTGGSAASFDAVDWGSDAHHIEVEVDAGSGYESLGSREFVSVPYALYAKSAGSGGGGGSLQSAYDGGNLIVVDSADIPVKMEYGNKTLFRADTGAVRMGHDLELNNLQLDVRYPNDNGPGPSILGASAPDVLPNLAFQSPFFQSSNTGVFGVGLGTRIATGVTGFSVHNNNTSGTPQDSIYGVTGIARDNLGKTSVGVSGLAQAYNDSVERSVGFFGQVDDQTTTDYQNDPFLAGGVFSANIDGPDTNLDTTFGAVGLGGFGGDHAIGVYGLGRGDTSLNNNTYGVIGRSGVSKDTNVGVLGHSEPLADGVALAGWFRFGTTLIDDTLQVNYGNPDSGEVLMAIDQDGKATWDSVPSGGTPLMPPSTNVNGNTIELAQGGALSIAQNGGSSEYFHASDGNPSLAVGHQEPIGSAGGSDVGLHVANEGANIGQLLISGGDNSGDHGAVLALSERLEDSDEGGELRYDAQLDRLILGREIGGSAPMLAVQGGSGSAQGVLIGATYAGTSVDPPQNGLLVEDTLGVGTTSPAHKHHIEGRTFSSEGFLTHDTAAYRYASPKARNEGIWGSEFRPSGSASGNRNYEVNGDGHAYFAPTNDSSLEMTASLELPDGAKVDSLVVHVHDRSSEALEIRVEKSSYGANSSSSTIPGTMLSSSVSGGAETLVADPAPFEIDKDEHLYRLRAIFPPGQGDQVRIANVRVHYSVTRTD